MSSNRDANLELSLREHLLLAQNQSHGSQTASSPPATAHEQNIDPAIAGPSSYQMSAGADSGGDDAMQDSRKGRRELSTSKRAAQNRAAQRAFRQRKEEYIKSLKDQVKEFDLLNDNYKAVQAENYALRDYVIALQSHLIDLQGTYPPPPAGINLSRDARPPPPPAVSSAAAGSAADGPSMSSAAVDQLVSAAQATQAHAGEGASNGQYIPAPAYSATKSERETRDWSPVCQ